MNKHSSLVCALALFAASAAWAHNCPNEMKAIDAKLATKPALSKDNADKVAKLRMQGEADHKAGKHAESLKALGDAKKILGI
jgi:hypothetical protein